MRVRSVAILAFGCSLAIAGCNRGSKAPVGPPEPVFDPWVLTTLDKDATAPALVTNGLVGLRLGRDATSDGGPMLLVDAYEKGGEERILPLANPFGVRWSDVGEKPFDWGDVRSYRQSLDMRDGLLRTTWSMHGIGFESLTVVHPELRIVAQRWTVSSNAPGRIRWRCGASGGELPPVLRVVNSLDSTRDTLRTARYQADVARGRDAVFERVVSMEPKGAVPTFAAVRQASLRAWKKRWETDIEIDGPAEDQQAIRSFLFYIRSSVNERAPRAVAPMGLSSQVYFGHVFWDADVWVFPALALIDPKAARTIPSYRLERERQARSNYDHWIASGRPVFEAKLGGRTPEMPSWRGVMFPWESSGTGKETVPGESRFEHHITGSVAWGLRLAGALGLADSDRVARVRKAAAAFYLSRIVRRPDGLFSLPAVVSPDEVHHGDDDLYTNVLAQGLIDEALARVSPKSRPRLIRPQDAEGLISYAGDPIRSYKQAAAVLTIYPLQDPGAESQSKTMMDRFPQRVSKNGPAMSESLHALIWARMGETENAYREWRRSWREFTRHPLLLFSEKRVRESTYFVTGAAGSLQTVLYGFLGFRVDFGQEPTADWSKLLKDRAWLSVTPHLPRSWRSATLRNFEVLGERYTLEVTHDGVHVIKGDP